MTIAVDWVPTSGVFVKKSSSDVPHKQEEILETSDKQEEILETSDDDEEALYRAISSLTNLWAEPASAEPSAHRVEIEAAVLANLDNPFINQGNDKQLLVGRIVCLLCLTKPFILTCTRPILGFLSLHDPKVVVVLDSVTNTSNCSHFDEHMTSLYKNRTSMFEYAHAGTPREMATLTCIDDPDGQPTYFKMFNYSQHPAVKGRVVVMHNADHAFDESLKNAREIRKDTILALATWGYAHMPTPLNHHLCLTIPENRRPRDNCSFGKKPRVNQEKRCAVNRRRGPPRSWDSYVFDKGLLKGKMTSEAERIFMRGNWKYPMNSMGSENAALYDFLQVSGNYSALNHFVELQKMSKGQRPVRAFQGCLYIASYHFHLAPKMHSEFGNKTVHKVAEGRTYLAAPFIRSSSDAFENETSKVDGTL